MNGTTSPAQELANLIVENLGNESLIPKRRYESVRAKLLNGNASEADWRLWIYAALGENSVDEEEVEIRDGEE